MIFNDFLLLMICSFFEFSAAALMSLNNFDWQTNSIFNMIVSVVLLVMMLGMIPLLFAGINKSRKTSKKSGKDLGVNYG